VVTHTNGSQTRFAASDNTDSARGTALLRTVADAQDGDHIDLSTGVFDIGTSAIKQGLTNGGVFHLHGAGKARTTIKRTSGDNAIIVPCSHSQTTDLTLFADDPRSTMSGWGIFGAMADIVDTWLHNVCISNWTDGILFGGNVKITANIINTSIFTRWDAVYFSATGGASVINFYNCDCIATADTNAAGSDGQARCYAITGGTLNLYGCTGVATDFPDVRENAYAVQTGVGRYAAGKAYLYGGSYHAARPQGLEPRSGREIDLYGGSSSARIYVSPSVKYSTFADCLIPQPYPPGSVADVAWSVPSLPARPHPKPMIINQAER
jgi:hypothetical protein